MATETVKDFVKGFVNGTLGRQSKHGNWIVTKLTDDIEKLTYNYGDREYPMYEDVAYKYSDGCILANSNEMNHAGVKKAWGHKPYNSDGRTDTQRMLESMANVVMFPFTLFEESNTSPENFKWVVKPVAETVTLIRTFTDYVWETGEDGKRERVVKQSKQPESRHFSGACIFKMTDTYYLFDVDRQELEHGIFNAFMTVLPSECNTIEEAYESLMPDEIREAINNKVDVKRQGEFYFIYHGEDQPRGLELTPEEKEIVKYIPSRNGFGIDTGGSTWRDTQSYSDSEVDSDLKREFNEAMKKYQAALRKMESLRSRQGSIGKSASGSHNLEHYVTIGEVSYVSGRVSQQRREHHDLILNGWYKVVPNSAVKSFTISGRID